VTRGWQTVGRSSAKLANSWPVYDIDGKQLGNVSRKLGHLQKCWQIVGRSSAMLANSSAMHMLAEGWAIFGDVGKQLGSLRLCWQTVGQTLVCTDPGTLINAFESSVYGEEQNYSDFPVLVFFEN